MHRAVLLAPACRLKPSSARLAEPVLLLKRTRSSTSTASAQRKRPIVLPRDVSRSNAQRGRYPPGTTTAPRKLPKPNFSIPQRMPMARKRIEPHLASHVVAWSQSLGPRQRFIRFGIPRAEIGGILKTYAAAVLAGGVLEALGYNDAQVQRLAEDLANTALAGPLDRTLSRLLYEWAAHPIGQAALKDVASPSTLGSMRELHQTADMSDPKQFYPRTRAGQPRKFIMHVGPTNSGKTHNALRALAAARSGVYAGPLRLLAHEIFERLNQGQIVPLGMDPEADAEPDPDTNFDVPMEGKGKVVVQKGGNPKYARLCNLLTGEERKVVDESAGLYSCTVEMLSLNLEFDVAVIDEIQLIADPERGGGWTQAVLGVNAREVHLCGEEAAVPIIEAMLRDTGEELVVNRYERLSPLQVAEKSLEGDLSRVQKGDCVVCFSRTQIIRLKDQIEAATGLKCAVAYGRLPPEIRSEQAALFNDPDSGYDVIVGSDAIGMGLNLKIRRIIFQAVQKWDGEQEQFLSVSQFKQIAGRAGRYGLHGDDSSGGVATTLDEEDLPVLRQALKQPSVPLKRAVVSAGNDRISAVMEALPPGTSMSAGIQAYIYVSKIHPLYEYTDLTSTVKAFDFVDRIADTSTLTDRLMLQNAPIAWRDPSCVQAAGNFIRIHRNDFHVKLHDGLQGTGLLGTLETVLGLMEQGEKVADSRTVLGVLETLHKVIVVYMWLHFRHQMAFIELPEAEELKQKTERAMDYCLVSLSKKSASKKAQVPKAVPIPASVTSPSVEMKEVRNASAASGSYSSPDGRFAVERTFNERRRQGGGLDKQRSQGGGFDKQRSQSRDFDRRPQGAHVKKQQSQSRDFDSQRSRSRDFDRQRSSGQTTRASGRNTTSGM